MSEYDAFAGAWDKTRECAWPEFDFFIPKLAKGDRVLDLGCGNGRLRQFLPSNLIRPGDYLGFDVSAELLKIARTKHPQDHFFKGDFSQKLPFGSDNFDWVISMAAFHHLLDKKSQNLCLAEIYRVLKPGGRVFITTWILPKKHFWNNFWHGRVLSKNWVIPFGPEKQVRTYRFVSDKDLKKLLKKSGFSVVQSQRYQNRNFVALGVKPHSLD